MLRSIFGFHGVLSGILAVAAVVLSLGWAWAYDRPSDHRSDVSTAI